MHRNDNPKTQGLPYPQVTLTLKVTLTQYLLAFHSGGTA